MKGLPILLPFLAVALGGCGDDPKPTHVTGTYRVGCQTGCSERDYSFTGDHEKGNSTDITGGDWPKVYVRCIVSSIEGAKSVQAFVSNNPLSESNDAGRIGFQIDSSVVADGVTDPYQITLWDPPGDFHVKNRDLMDGQAPCDSYSVDITGSDSFNVDFVCPDMRTTFALPARYTRVGHIEFSHCD
jgi:hypothetical protein